MTTVKLSKDQLKEKLDSLQCHFTWKLGVDSFSPSHLLQKLAVEINHTSHQNQVALLGLQAYLQHLNNQSREALQSLRAAEEHNGEEEQPASTAGSLIIYGNFAWIYFLQASYQEAENYLERVQQLCPAPWDAGLIPHIQAQKGWSLLALRAWNGERARECFDVALMFEPENRSFRTGLGMALCSSWNYFRNPDLASEAMSQLERIVHEQPNNYRAKIYLAGLLVQVDREKSIGLVNECAEKSSDPEVLKLAVFFWMSRSTEKAFEILQRALQQDPGYHLLYRALAKCYKKQLNAAKKADKNRILDAAIRDLQQIIKNHPDLELTLTKLQLAEFLGARDPVGQEEILKELQGKIDTLSVKCRQALNVAWGKFFLYQKNCLDKAKAKFMEGYSISTQTDQGKECERRLRKMAQICQCRGDTKTASDIYSFLEKTDRRLSGELAALSLEDEENPSLQRGGHGLPQG